MGFFSSDCKGCGHPMLSEWSTSPINDWMRSVVIIAPNGEPLSGIYDGYGRVDNVTSPPNLKGEHGITMFVLGGREPCCYHTACWNKDGQPTECVPSTYSADQGFFFEDEHDIACPVDPPPDLPPPTRGGPKGGSSTFETPEDALKAVVALTMQSLEKGGGVK